MGDIDNSRLLDPSLLSDVQRNAGASLFDDSSVSRQPSERKKKSEFEFEHRPVGAPPVKAEDSRSETIVMTPLKWRSDSTNQARSAIEEKVESINSLGDHSPQPKSKMDANSLPVDSNQLTHAPERTMPINSLANVPYVDQTNTKFSSLKNDYAAEQFKNRIPEFAADHSQEKLAITAKSMLPNREQFVVGNSSSGDIAPGKAIKSDMSNVGHIPDALPSGGTSPSIKSEMVNKWDISPSSSGGGISPSLKSDILNRLNTDAPLGGGMSPSFKSEMLNKSDILSNSSNGGRITSDTPLATTVGGQALKSEGSGRQTLDARATGATDVASNGVLPSVRQAESNQPVQNRLDPSHAIAGRSDATSVPSRAEAAPPVQSTNGAQGRVDGVPPVQTNNVGPSLGPSRAEAAPPVQSNSGAQGRVDAVPPLHTNNVGPSRSETVPSVQGNNITHGRVEPVPPGPSNSAPQSRVESAHPTQTNNVLPSRSETAHLVQTNSVPPIRVDAISLLQNNTTVQSRIELGPLGPGSNVIQGRIETALSIQNNNVLQSRAADASHQIQGIGGVLVRVEANQAAQLNLAMQGRQEIQARPELNQSLLFGAGVNAGLNVRNEPRAISSNLLTMPAGRLETATGQQLGANVRNEVLNPSNVSSASSASNASNAINAGSQRLETGLIRQPVSPSAAAIGTPLRNEITATTSSQPAQLAGRGDAISIRTGQFVPNDTTKVPLSVKGAMAISTTGRRPDSTEGISGSGTPRALTPVTSDGRSHRGGPGKDGHKGSGKDEFILTQQVDRGGKREMTGVEIGLIMSLAGLAKARSGERAPGGSAGQESGVIITTISAHQNHEASNGSKPLLGGELTLSAIIALTGTGSMSDVDQPLVDKTIPIERKIGAGGQHTATQMDLSSTLLAPRRKDAFDSDSSSIIVETELAESLRLRDRAEEEDPEATAEETEPQDEKPVLATIKPRQRPNWLMSSNETMNSIAEALYKDANLGWLIADLNADKIKETWLEGKRIIEIDSRQKLELPVAEDIEEFYARKQPEVDPANLVTIVEERRLDKDLVEGALHPLLGLSA